MPGGEAQVSGESAPLMEANAPRMTDALLPVLNLPKDGRLLSFGAGGAMAAMEIAEARDDVLVVICDTSYETTRRISDLALERGLHNVVIGDSPAGPPVDRALVFQSTQGLQGMDLVTIRTAILPGGYAVFVDSSVDGAQLAEQLKAVGYAVTDVLDPLGDYTVVRAR